MVRSIPRRESSSSMSSSRDFADLDLDVEEGLRLWSLLEVVVVGLDADGRSARLEEKRARMDRLALLLLFAVDEEVEVEEAPLLLLLRLDVLLGRAVVVEELG